MIYILLLLLSLLLIGPLVLIIASFFIFRKRVKVSGNFSQIYDNVYSMLHKMQRGEFNFDNFQNQTRTKSAGDMSKAEAIDVLGLKTNAKPAEINKAYHKLMQKIHPDKGGSDYLARQLNKARDTLLK